MKMEVWRWKIKPNTLNSLVGGASQGGLCHWLPYSTVLLRAWAFTASSCKVRPNVSWHSSQSLHLLVFGTDYFKQVPWRLGECLHTCKSWNFLQNSPSPIHQCHCLLRGQGAHTGSKCGFLSFPQTVHQQVQRTQYSEINGFSHSRNPRLGVSPCPGYTSPLQQLPWLFFQPPNSLLSGIFSFCKHLIFLKLKSKPISSLHSNSKISTVPIPCSEWRFWGGL